MSNTPSTNAPNSKLNALLKSTQSGRAVNGVLPKSRNLAMQVEEYVQVDGVLMARGLDLITQKKIEVELKVKAQDTQKEGSPAQRTMSDIRDVSPPGTIIQFNGCYEDKANPSRYNAYYAKTPYNVVVAEGQQKQVNFNVIPGRLIQTQSKRWAAVTYDFKNGSAINTMEQAYKDAAMLFADKRAVYIRVRVDSPSEGIKKNEAFEFFPVVESVSVEGGKNIGVVNVEASLNKIKASVLHKYWLKELSELQGYLGKEVNIDLMPIDITWGSASARRENKLTIEQKAYGLDKRNGFFSADVKMITNNDGSPARYYDTVATNLMLAELVTQQDGNTIRTATSATPLGTECRFTSISELPVVINGQLAYAPAEESVFTRRLTMDGTYAREAKSAPENKNEQAANAAPASNAAQTPAHVELNDSMAAAHVDVPDIDDSYSEGLDVDYHPSEDDYDPLAGLSNGEDLGLNLDDVLSEIDQDANAAEQQQVATQAPKMVM